MDEIESLIKQAKSIKAQWYKPIIKSQVTTRAWQEILDNAPYPKLRVGKL